MFPEKTIKVTPNVEHCLKIFEDAIGSAPEGEKKDEAISALDYLRKAAEGEEKELVGWDCPFKFVPLEGK